MYKATKNLLPIIILLISIPSIAQWTSIQIGNTLTWWIVNSICIILFFYSKRYFYEYANEVSIKYIKLFFIWSLITFVRGLFIAEYYWDFKNLIDTQFYFSLSAIIYIGTNSFFVQKIFSIWLKVGLILFLFLFPFMNGESYGRFLVPLSMLLIYFPLLSSKWKIIFMFFTFIVIFGYLDGRSNIIKFIIPLLISLLYFARNFSIHEYLRYFRIIILVAPFFFLILGLTNIFNIFSMDEYIGNYTTTAEIEGEKKIIEFTSDTRTFIYHETINSSINNNAVIFGRTGARGYESDSFGGISRELKMNRNERYSSEVSILNIFNWTGIVGVILFFLVFYQASYLAIYKSNNFFIKMLGVYILFRWFYLWIEDFNKFDLNNIFLWISISMCISIEFRKMDNREFRNWVLGIFDIKYRSLTLLNLNKNVQK